MPPVVSHSTDKPGTLAGPPPQHPLVGAVPGVWCATRHGPAPAVDAGPDTMALMSAPRTLAVVLAGGRGSRMDVLTRERAKPALPFAGTHRLIDVPLTNLRRSGIEDVFVSVQYHATSLDEVVANGRPWDLDRTYGGLRLVGPEEGGSPEHSGFASGNADVLLKLRRHVRHYAPDVLLVCSADHVYRLDFGAVVATHLAHEADATVVTTQLSKREAVHHATVETAGRGPVRAGAAVTGWTYKPSRAETDVVATEIFAYAPEVLMDTLGELHTQLGPDAGHGDSGLGDFGEKLIPRLIERGRVVAHPLEGYWRDAGRPDSYLRLHRDILAGRVDLFTDDRGPLLGMPVNGLPAHVDAGAVVEDSMLAPRARVAGRVTRSVIGPGVQIAAGAHVVDSVLLAGSRIEAGAFVGTAVVDEHVVVGPGARLGVETGTQLPVADDISLVGRDSVIGGGVVLPPGSRLEPGTRA